MKLCRKIYDKRYRESIKGKIAQRHYRQTEKGKITNRKAVQRHRQTEKGKLAHCQESLRYHIRHPEQRKAGHAVSSAIRNGKLLPIKTFQCCYCPAQAKYYHHWNYVPKYWLDVVPICLKCHIEIHKRVVN